MIICNCWNQAYFTKCAFSAQLCFDVKDSISKETWGCVGWKAKLENLGLNKFRVKIPP